MKEEETEVVQEIPVPKDDKTEDFEDLDAQLPVLSEGNGDLLQFLKLPARHTDLKLTREQYGRVIQQVRALRTGGHAAVPLVCGGQKGCPFVTFCALTEYDQNGNIDPNSPWPKYRQCPIELNVIAGRIIDLCREFSVSTTNITDMAIITKIAEIDIYDQRLSMCLAKEDNQSLLRDEVSNIDKEGHVYYTLKAHPALEIKERLARQRETLVKSMVGTRREKLKLLSSQDNESDLVKKLTKLRSALEKAFQSQGEPIDAEFTEIHRQDEGQ